MLDQCRIFESHAHYEDEQFDEDRDALLNSFDENGIDYVVNNASSIKTTEQTIELTKKYPFVYGTVGVHPEECGEMKDEDIEWLREMSKQDKIVAIGEIGLDYYWKEPDPEIQRVWFRKQIELARECGLPIVVHSRDAAKDTYDIMMELNCEEIGGVVHCFSYPVEMAKLFLNMGFYIGVGGVVTFKNAKHLKEVVEFCPLDRIVLETDSPYLAPVPNRGKRNSSLNLIHIAETIAEIKGITTEEVIQATYKNACDMYRIPCGK